MLQNLSSAAVVIGAHNEDKVPLGVNNEDKVPLGVNNEDKVPLGVNNEDKVPHSKTQCGASGECETAGQ